MTLKSWIHEIEIVNSWSWNLEFTKLNLWSWNREFMKLKSWILWSWNRDLMKLKTWLREFCMLKTGIQKVKMVFSWRWNRNSWHEVEMALPVFRSSMYLCLLHLWRSRYYCWSQYITNFWSHDKGFSHSCKFIFFKVRTWFDNRYRTTHYTDTVSKY
jgi:hypothetical protein